MSNPFGLNTPVISDIAAIQLGAAIAQGCGPNGKQVYGGNYLPVANTPTSGQLGPTPTGGPGPGLDAAQSTNIWLAFVLTQTTASVTITPPNLTGPAATGPVVETFTNDANTSTVSFTMLGATVAVGATAVLLWTPGAAGGWTLLAVASPTPGGNYWPFASGLASGLAVDALWASDNAAIVMTTALGGIARRAGTNSLLNPGNGNIADQAVGFYVCNVGTTWAAQCNDGNLTLNATDGNVMVDASGTVGCANAAATQFAVGGSSSSCASIQLTTNAGGTCSIQGSNESCTTSIGSGGSGGSVKTLNAGSQNGASESTFMAGSGGFNIFNNGYNVTWPSSAPTAGQVLAATTANTLGWAGASTSVFTQTTNAQSIANTGTPATITNWTDITPSADWVPLTGVYTAPAGPTAVQYAFGATVAWAATAQALGAAFTLSILHESATVTATQFTQPVAALSQVHSQSAYAAFVMAPGDTASVQASLSGGTGSNALTATANENTLSISQQH